ncbi:hypothetical protein FACS18949_03420 [Clostridia bacterium]|nr:hypothetical protein FACS18949_03420 [Clostridia bacterium]
MGNESLSSAALKADVFAIIWEVKERFCSEHPNIKISDCELYKALHKLVGIKADMLDEMEDAEEDDPKYLDCHKLMAAVTAALTEEKPVVERATGNAENVLNKEFAYEVAKYILVAYQVDAALDEHYEGELLNYQQKAITHNLLLAKNGRLIEPRPLYAKGTISGSFVKALAHNTSMQESVWFVAMIYYYMDILSRGDTEQWVLKQILVN